MALSARELFKRSFIKQCAAEGLVEEDQVLDRISSLLEKSAGPIDYMQDLHKRWHRHTVGVRVPGGKREYGPSPVPEILATGVALPAAAGAGAGMLASKLKGNWLDESDVKQQELIDELKKQTELARQFRRIGGTAPSSF